VSARKTGGGAGSPRTSTGSFEGDHLLRKLETARKGPEAAAAPVDVQDLSDEGTDPGAKALVEDAGNVVAPSLENLEVTVPHDLTVSQGELLLRFHELVRAHSPSRPRKNGEAVRMGDSVVLDTLGYAQGRLIPFSARTGLELEMAPSDLLPGLCEGLEGTPVGGSKQVDVVLPESYPVEALRGTPATFLVDVVSAREVKVPKDAESDAFVRKLGRGDTLEALMEALASDIADERADDAWLEAQERVLDELILRTEVAITPELVDEEIRRNWNTGEAPLLVSKNFGPDEMQESLDGWMTDPGTRLETERRLRIAYALRAIIERDGVKLTPESLDEVLEEAIIPFGLSLEEARGALADPALAETIRHSALHVVAVRYVMSHAEVRFEGIPGRFSGSGKPMS